MYFKIALWPPLELLLLQGVSFIVETTMFTRHGVDLPISKFIGYNVELGVVE